MIKQGFNVVMLPTKEANCLFTFNKGKKISDYHKPQQGDGINIINQYLYITVDRKEEDESTWIKEGDWIYPVGEHNPIIA